MRSLNAPYTAPADTRHLKILTASKNNNSTPGYPADCWLVCRQIFMLLFCTLMVHVCKIDLNDELKTKH